MQDPEKLTHLLRKIRALAEGGVEGERDAARYKLRELMRKHGITLDALAEDKTRIAEFYIPPGSEALFVTIGCAVLKTDRIRTAKVGTGRMARYLMELTATQEMEMRAMCQHYFAIYESEHKRLERERKTLAARHKTKVAQLAHAIILRFDIGYEVPDAPANNQTPLSAEQMRALRELYPEVTGTAYTAPKPLLQ